MVFYVQQAVQIEQFMPFQIRRGGPLAPKYFLLGFNGTPHPLGCYACMYVCMQTCACSAKRQQPVWEPAARVALCTEVHVFFGTLVFHNFSILQRHRQCNNPMHCTQCKYIPLMFDTSRVAKFRRFRQHFLATVSLLGVWNTGKLP